MNSIDILYDHYKETYQLSKEAQARRNKSFLLLCLLEALSFFISIRPEKAFELLQSGIQEQLGFPLSSQTAILQTLLWIVIIYIFIRYVQDMLYIERQYLYLEQLEQALSHSLDTWELARESRHYRQDYPVVLNLIDLFYKLFMPVFFTVINTLRIYREWAYPPQNSMLSRICDTVLYGAVFLLAWFYFFEIHPEITKFCKRHIPFAGKAADWLRKILEKV